MKKTNVSPLTEIQAETIQTLNDYLEEAISIVLSDMIGASSGVITGLTTILTGGFNNRVTVSSGIIYRNRLYGQLENPGSGFITNLPTSGSKTDIIVASYIEVYDTPGSGYVLLDTTSGIETVVNNNTRKLGAVKLELLESTLASAVPSGKILIAQIDSTNTGITAVTDLRLMSRSTRYNQDVETDFYGVFYAGF